MRPDPPPARAAGPCLGVERRVFTEALWSQPFPALLRLAQAGQDGLRLLPLTDADGVYRDAAGRLYSATPSDAGALDLTGLDLTGLAVLRRGDRDRAVLYAQGW